MFLPARNPVIYLSLNLPMKTQKTAPDENILSVWRDEKTATFLK